MVFSGNLIASHGPMSTANFLKSILSRFRYKSNQNMASLEAMQKLESKAVQTENLIGLLKAEVIAH